MNNEDINASHYATKIIGCATHQYWLETGEMRAGPKTKLKREAKRGRGRRFKHIPKMIPTHRDQVKLPSGCHPHLLRSRITLIITLCLAPAERVLHAVMELFVQRSKRNALWYVERDASGP